MVVQMIKRIIVEVQADTYESIRRLAAMQTDVTVEQIAGQLLDAQVVYQLEVDQMRRQAGDEPPFGAGY